MDGVKEGKEKTGKEQDKYKFWFASMLKLSPEEKLHLKNEIGQPEEIYRISEYELEKIHTIPQKTKNKLLELKQDRKWEQTWESFRNGNIRLICMEDKEYPDKLKKVYAPPYGLFVKGKLPKEEKIVAIVGARGCSAYGEAMAKSIAGELAKKKIGVISGLALGIDAAAHAGALEGNGDTYGIMGCGVDVCYPAVNRNLYEQMKAKGGIISEFPCGCQPLKHLFPLRNRIISGLADAVIVVEARKRSGSLITADYALEQGKLVYAVPGRISDSLSYGTNWLLSQGAAPFYSVTEFLKDMGVELDKKKQQKKIMEILLEKNERLVYSVLDFTPKHLETIIEATGLEFLAALTAVNGLEINGYVKEVYRNHYVKTAYNN